MDDDGEPYCNDPLPRGEWRYKGERLSPWHAPLRTSSQCRDSAARQRGEYWLALYRQWMKRLKRMAVRP